MIIRGYLRCETCDHPHIVRIGMGQEVKQRHIFACRSCHEDVEVGLDVDYGSVSVAIFHGKNAVGFPELAEGSIVNLDANFLIPKEDQGKELVFPRLQQSVMMAQKVIDARRAQGLPDVPDDEGFNPRRPDFAAEWEELRAAWSLARNGKEDLSAKRIAKASKAYYAYAPLTDLADWVWRFSFALGGPRYHGLFEASMAEIKKARTADDMPRLLSSFDAEIGRPHSRIFFELMKAYFAAFDEFAQVQFLVASEADFPEANAASSNFDAVRMFYGNAFEAFSRAVEFLAYVNNLLSGRKFDEFASMTRGQYLRLDNASRFRCFEANPAFTALCAEADNALRNASHHNGFIFDPPSQVISYQAGKGGQGAAQEISYTEYLKRCTEIFLQAMTLLRLELVLANGAKLQPPL